MSKRIVALISHSVIFVFILHGASLSSARPSASTVDAPRSALAEAVHEPAGVRADGAFASRAGSLQLVNASRRSDETAGSASLGASLSDSVIGFAGDPPGAALPGATITLLGAVLLLIANRLRKALRKGLQRERLPASPLGSGAQAPISPVSGPEAR